MKKLLTICLTLAPCALMAATNKISMVTYFPVPYVAYSHVNADQIDVGLTTSGCSMKLGCSESPQPPLKTSAVKVQSGKLELNGGLGILGNSITLGSGNTGTGHLSFSNVRIATGNMESVNADKMAVDTLNLFGQLFPSCKEANSASNGQMSWQSLTLQGASNQELYLVCGGDTPATCGTPTNKGQETYEVKCELEGDMSSGKKVYKWNPDPAVCDYELVSNTCSNLKQCLTKVMYCAGHDDATGADGTIESCCNPGADLIGGVCTDSLNNSCTDYKLKGTGFNFWYHSLPYSVSSNYGSISETGCEPGTPCNTCTLGKRYIQSPYNVPGQCCYGGSEGGAGKHTLYLVQYAVCGMMADCSSGTVSACSNWKHTEDNGSNIHPFLPGEKEFE
ncbi:MAG: hypothetical protein ACI351_02750 [Candidatus Avelusimicrobium sp.]|uniref:hypothetical protein n=1 Tax=Candidatus Avelusimicrobium sp. TaxID=3048833 RepID=UPI003F0E9807